MTDDSGRENLREAALEFHRAGRPGKIEVVSSKPLATQRDLALAYSPGVAEACNAIVEDPESAAELTARANLVAVVTNGTAVLGLGAIGPLASKPVMEGKGVLFKKFAGIDVFDIELDETDPDKLVDIIRALEPTFGGINLEDIKAPECFDVEARCRASMNIPVFHDDQHGTAIIVAAAVRNALKVVDKRIEEVRLVASGAGAAAIACLDLLVTLGLKRENITVTDILGVVWRGRPEQMDPRKAEYAIETEARTLAEVIGGADIFLGLSAPGVLKPDYLERMAERPIVMALANPTPEIMPDLVAKVRPDAVIATGRSDFPNQVNNVLCFPFIFRGALDVGATAINEEMKVACVEAIADLAMAEASEIVDAAYGEGSAAFGPDNLIPKPFDPRLIVQIAPAVAQAAMRSGVATRPIADMAAYRQKLESFVYRSQLTMRPVILRAQEDTRRIAFAEGEDDRVLRAVQTCVDERLCRPLLIGRPEVVERRIRTLGLRLRRDEHFELTDPHNDKRFGKYWRRYLELSGRRGVAPPRAQEIVRTNPTVIAALMVDLGDADSMICGTFGPYRRHLRYVMGVFGLRQGIRTPAALNVMILPQGPLFIADTFIVPDPTPQQIADITELAADEMRRFGLTPKAALVSHSNFGTFDTPSASRMRAALGLIRTRQPDLEIDGEMHAETALMEEVRDRTLPGSHLTGAANLLIMPSLDAANIAYNLIRSVTGCVTVGPLLLGLARPAHIVTPAISVRGLMNVAAVAAVDAQIHAAQAPVPPGHHQGYFPGEDR